MAKQLDLFLDQKARVFAFPPARRRDLVVSAVSILMSKSNLAGARWWKRHSAEIAEPLLGLGMGRDATAALIADYAREVSREMTILRYRNAG